MRRYCRLLLGSLVLALVAFTLHPAVAPAADPAVVTPPAGSRLPLNGAAAFLTGANLPWYNWACDFGCGDTGTPATSGVSNATNKAALAATFAQAHAAGLRVIRWWLFEGSAASQDIAVDSKGVPTQVTAATYADIDAALDLANQYDLYFDFVLFSAPTAVPQNWVTDPGTAVGLASAIGGLAAHYDGNPRIFSWELYNEPETDIWAGRIDQASVQSSVKTITAAIHAQSHAYVTVGSVFLDGLPMWVGLGLDYYEAHWYDYMNQGNYDALLWDYPTLKARYHLDKPLILGEFPATPQSSNPSAAQRWAHWYTAGYAGAWSWSLLPSHTADGFAVDQAVTSTFVAQAPQDTGPSAPLLDDTCLTLQTAQAVHNLNLPGGGAQGIERTWVLGAIWAQCVAAHGGAH